MFIGITDPRWVPHSLGSVCFSAPLAGPNLQPKSLKGLLLHSEASLAWEILRIATVTDGFMQNVSCKDQYFFATHIPLVVVHFSLHKALTWTRPAVNLTETLPLSSLS